MKYIYNNSKVISLRLKEIRNYLFTPFLMLLVLLLITTISTYAQTDYIQQEIKAKKALLEKAMEKNNITPNQESYDALYYMLDLNVDPSAGSVDGSVTTNVQVINGPLNTIDLHFAENMNVDQVMVNETTATFSRTDDILTVDLEREYINDEEVTVKVYYNGEPIATGLGSYVVTSYSGKPLVTTLSFPYGARDWWPCKDISNDKPDNMDIKFTVPEGMQAASNGILMDESTSDGKTTFHWKVNYPISTYLVCLTAYEYTHYSDFYVSTKGDTLPIEFYVAPDHYENSTENFYIVKEMIAIYSELFGEYPFMEDKYGHAEFPWGGGMEHQTMTSLGPIGSSNGIYSLGLIAHELAHMWWGDMITCSDFHHIWINEGFATYSEALILEVVDGPDGYFDQISTSEYYGAGTVYCDDATDIGRILHRGLSYDKGAYVLHMLRHVVGDDTFFDILKTYYNNSEMKYGNASTEDFQNVCESVSGKDLDQFFTQWIYGEYYPYYSWGYTVEELSSGEGYLINLYIDQIQDNTGLFSMPIDIKVTTAKGEEIIIVDNSLFSEQYEIIVSEEPINVELDPQNWILKKTRDKLLNPPLDQGALLVNGINWALGPDVKNAYEEKAFWGNTQISFWDLFDEPSGGYPSTLPDPVGNGELTAKNMGDYSTLIWLSHNQGGDLNMWNNLPISDYLNEGGNIILITRNGQSFVSNYLADYLGITWNDEPLSIIAECHSEYEDLIDMELSRNHTLVSLFNAELAHEYSQLLFTETVSFDEPKGLGVWSSPTEGGQFIYIAARPFLFNNDQLRQNMEYILTTFFSEPTGIENEASLMPAEYKLFQNYPNPFNPSTTIKYNIAHQSVVRLKIHNLLGEEITELVNEEKPAGYFEVDFDAENFSSGVYFYQLSAESVDGSAKYLNTKKMIVLK